MICDICNAPGVGTHVSSDDMRHAVNVNGFNPFALGLADTNVMKAMGLNPRTMFEQWKVTMVAGDTAGWNVCPRCMSKLSAARKRWYQFWK